MRIIATKAEMPPGDYLIGDPCYAINDRDAWMQWLEASDFKSNPELYATEDFPGVAAVHTALGDGTYLDQHGHEFSVDAGLLGVVAVQTYEKYGQGATVSDLMLQVTFHEPFTVSYDDGIVRIGEYEIDTDPVDDVYDEDEDDDLR